MSFLQLEILKYLSVSFPLAALKSPVGSVPTNHANRVEGKKAAFLFPFTWNLESPQQLGTRGRDWIITRHSAHGLDRPLGPGLVELTTPIGRKSPGLKGLACSAFEDSCWMKGAAHTSRQKRNIGPGHDLKRPGFQFFDSQNFSMFFLKSCCEPGARSLLG